ncbi:MAG: EAL domain-containing protein [Pseudomonadales bacterium]
MDDLGMGVSVKHSHRGAAGTTAPGEARHGSLAARPWLVALLTLTAAVLAVVRRGDTVLLTAERFDLALAIPLEWILLPSVATGMLGLLLMLVRTPGPEADADRTEPGISLARPPPEDHLAAPATPADADPAPNAGAAAMAAPALSDGGPGEHADPANDGQGDVAGTDPDALALALDDRGRVRRCNAPMAQILEAEPATLTGTNVIDLVPSRIRQPLIKAVRAARAEPGVPLQLPVLRLQHRGAAIPTPPLRLTVTAGTDGTMTVSGRVAQSPGIAAASFGQSDDRFSRVFHSSPDAILIVRNRDAVIIDFNEGFTRLLGYTREAAIGRTEMDLHLWAEPEARRGLLGTLRSQRNATDVEARLRTASGSTVPVEISLRYIELDGELCVLCIGRDISKRLQAESAARSSEEKFSRVFSQSPDGIVILRASDLVIRDANLAFVRGSGYSADELIGQPIQVFRPALDNQALEQTLATLAREGHISNREMQFRVKNGHELTALISGTLTEFDGEQCLLCIIKDITELRRAQEQLQRSEERFRGAFENAPIGILLLDTQGHIFQANRFATELLHYRDQALNSTHISRLVPADERADLKEQLERLMRGSEPTLRNERRMLCGDGLEIWTNCHMVLQQTPDGEPLYCIMQIADITEMKTSQRKMERLAFYDTLTELANRRLFNDRLQQAVEHCRRHKERAALLYLDLDQFKRVNDTLGHESGDALLREVADRLLNCVRKEDTVGRPGGDEFTILLYDVEAPDHAGQVAEKILRELQRPISLSGHQLVVTTSIGITVIPDDGTEPAALLKNADLAMYRAKEKGRNNYQFYSEELNTNAVRRLRIEYELRRALERSEFELHFQPVVRLSDQSIIGVECLLRWNHPERGSVPPDDFIPVAEETGAIVEIGNWVIQEACAAGRLMTDQRGAPVSIAVNISPRQFRDPELVNTIRRSLRRAHLDPGCLEVEITETMLMQDVEAASDIVRRLHKLGIRLAIDDFGTGYSSLNYLKKFPINTVKVDRSFVADIPESSDDMEITASVIAMAHRLRMQVVAEGVETQEQLAFLAEQGCDFAQGWLFSRALPLKDIRPMLGTSVRLLRGPGVSA